jgi:hypothetical protein
LLSSIEALIVKSGNGEYLGWFSFMNNWSMVATGIVNCIFSGSLELNSNVLELGLLQHGLHESLRTQTPPPLARIRDIDSPVCDPSDELLRGDQRDRHCGDFRD